MATRRSRDSGSNTQFKEVHLSQTLYESSGTHLGGSRRCVAQCLQHGARLAQAIDRVTRDRRVRTKSAKLARVRERRGSKGFLRCRVYPVACGCTCDGVIASSSKDDNVCCSGLLTIAWTSPRVSLPANTNSGQARNSHARLLGDVSLPMSS